MPGTSAEYFFDKAFLLSCNLILKASSAPENEAQLFKLIETAMQRGFDTQSPLKEIHLPLERFPDIDSKFWHVPIEDCGPAPVLRLFFEPLAETLP